METLCLCVGEFFFLLPVSTLDLLSLATPVGPFYHKPPLQRNAESLDLTHY